MAAAQETAHIAPTSVWALVRGQGGTSWRPRRMASDAYRTLFQLKEYHLLQVGYLSIILSYCHMMFL